MNYEPLQLASPAFLSGAIASGATTLTIRSAANWPSDLSGTFRVLIDKEIKRLQGAASGSLTWNIVQAGAETTQEADHNDWSLIAANVTPQAIKNQFGGVNPCSGNYTIAGTDARAFLPFQGSGAVTLPQATAGDISAFGPHFLTTVMAQSGTVTITPASGTINGAASLSLTNGQWATIYSDGTNYWDTPMQGGGGASLTSGSVTSGYLGDGSVVNGSIASGQINAHHISSGTIIAGAGINVVANASNITISNTSGSFSLTSGIITSGMLGDYVVNSNNVNSGAITITKLASGLQISGLVFSGGIGSGQIGGFHVASGVVNAGAGISVARDGAGAFTVTNTSGSFALTSGIITSGMLGDFVVNSNNVNSGAITITKLASGLQISGLVFSGGIGSGQIGGFHHASGVVNAGVGISVARDSAGGFTITNTSGAGGGASLTSGSVTSGYIGNNAVVSGSIASGQISTFHLASGAKIDSAEWLYDDSFTTAETISGVRAVSIDLSGLARIATFGSSRTPAIGMCFDNVVSGSVAKILTYGRVYRSDAWYSGGWLQTNYSGVQGNGMFLTGASSGMPTYSPIGSVSGSIQNLGWVINGSGFFIAPSSMVLATNTPLNAGVQIQVSVASPNANTITMQPSLLSGGVQSGFIGNGAVVSGSIASGVAVMIAQAAGGDLTGTYPNPTIVNLRGYIDGMVTANVGSGTQTMLINAGQARDSTNVTSIVTTSTYYKSLAGTWTSGAGVSGTPKNGLDAGSASGNCWYYTWAINASGLANDFLFSPSPTSPTMPTGFGFKRLIGAMKTNASGQWMQYIQKHDFFEWSQTQQEINATGQTASTTTVLNLAYVPGAYAVEARLCGTIKNTSEVGDALYIGDADATNQIGAGVGARVWGTNADTGNFYGTVNNTWTGNSGKIFYGQNAAAGTPLISISTIGWSDPRGKDL